MKNLYKDHWQAYLKLGLIPYPASRNGKNPIGRRREDEGLEERIGGQIFILYFLKLLLRRRGENLVKNKDATPKLS